jgi:hypothetical protein
MSIRTKHVMREVPAVLIGESLNAIIYLQDMLRDAWNRSDPQGRREDAKRIKELERLEAKLSKFYQ